MTNAAWPIAVGVSTSLLLLLHETILVRDVIRVTASGRRSCESASADRVAA